MKVVNYFSLILLAIMASACDKNLLDEAVNYTPVDGTVANVKIVHAYAGKAPALTTGAGPSVFIYWGTDKLNGAGLGFTNSNGLWPAPSVAATNAKSFYAALTPGERTFYGVMARTSATLLPAGQPAPIAGDTIFTLKTKLDAGQYYTLFLTDTLPTPQIIVVPERQVTAPVNKYWLRYVNLIAWPSDLIDVSSVKENRKLFTNVSYKSVTDYIELNVPKGRDTLVFRKVGGSSPGTYVDSVFLTPSHQRAYTYYGRGKNLSGTSAVFQNRGLGITTHF